MPEQTTAVDPVLEISTDNISWYTSLQIKSGEEANLYYRIKTNGNADTRIIFPVYDKDNSVSVPASEALMDMDQWNNMQLTIVSPASGVNISKSNVVTAWAINARAVEEIVLQYSFTPDPATEDHSAIATCGFECRNETTKKWSKCGDGARIKITKDTKPPFVSKFTATHTVLVNNDGTTMSWEVANADSINLQVGTTDPETNVPIGNKKIKNLKTDTTIRLTPIKDGHAYTSEEIVLKVYGSSALVIVSSLFDDGSLMNLFTADDTDILYALVLTAEQDNVLMWETRDGWSWNKTIAYSNIPAFISDQNKTNVPLEFAGSPSVIFNSKLYLIGGSRFDPNAKSNKVYYYDFTDIQSGWQQAPDAPFTARMGQACVLYNEQVCVLGGCDEQGAINDMYLYDSHGQWIKSTINLPGNRCMVSAIVADDQIQIFGGFSDLPGTPDLTIDDSYYFDGAWHKMTWDSSIEKINYTGCGIGLCKTNRFLFSSVYNGKMISRLQRISKNFLVDVPDMDLSMDQFYYSIQAVTFKDVVWLCVIDQDSGPQSNDLRYFVYVPSKINETDEN